jgi:hypothetical protein
MPLGGLVALAILLPNLVYWFLPPREQPAQPLRKDTLFRLMEGLERVGQVGVFLLPFFYSLPPLREASVDALAFMALAWAFTVSAWVRYASKGHRHVLLYAPFLGVPLPLAVGPVIYFFSAAVFLRSWPVAVAAVIFATGHLMVSAAEWNRARPRDDSALFPFRRG